jgi:hypothetical protein
MEENKVKKETPSVQKKNINNNNNNNNNTATMFYFFTVTLCFFSGAFTGARTFSPLFIRFIFGKC